MPKCTDCGGRIGWFQSWNLHGKCTNCFGAVETSSSNGMESCHKCGRKVPKGQLKTLMLLNPGDPLNTFCGSACPSCFEKLTRGHEVL